MVLLIALPVKPDGSMITGVGGLSSIKVALLLVAFGSGGYNLH